MFLRSTKILYIFVKILVTARVPVNKIAHESYSLAG